MKPKISVIIPVYNGEKYLRDCLDIVLGQTIKNIEVLIVDDGSTDSTRNILKCYEAVDERAKPIYQANQGPAMRLNKRAANSLRLSTPTIGSNEKHTRLCTRPPSQIYGYMLGLRKVIAQKQIRR
ncbi:glycosyltransferase family A protein [Bacillus subtilis]|nr:glycosyltransferase family A protein [Bacillus subtilis]MEC2233921.1 glycosyltransferase family A protein [Bacillus subtilis]